MKKLIMFAMLLVLALTFTACGQGVSQADYDKLLDEVNRLNSQLNEVDDTNDTVSTDDTSSNDDIASVDDTSSNKPIPGDRKQEETPITDFVYGYDATLGGVVIKLYTGTSLNVRIPDFIDGYPVVGLGNGHTVELGRINGVFINSGIASIHIPDSVTSIGERAFWGCKGLTSIDLPNGLTSIGEEAFNLCTGLTSINIPEGVTRIEKSMFGSCTGLTHVELPDSITYIGVQAFTDYYEGQNGFKYHKHMNISKIVIPTNAYVDPNAFAFCCKPDIIYK